MRPRRRNLWLTALVTPALLMSFVPVAHAAKDELEQLRTCISESKHVAVAVIIDESGSLQNTDPADERVTAAKAAVAGLSVLASEGAADVDLLIAGFSEVFSHRQEGPLNESSIAGFNAEIDLFTDRDSGRDTDFYVAIDGARQWLEGKRHGAGSTPAEFCSALLLFTDGEYSIEPQAGREAKPYAPGIPPTSEEAAARVVQIGQEKICKKDGLSDRLRALGTVPVVISLNKTAFNQSFMTSFATGDGCGDRGADVPGIFRSANDLTDLLQLFDAIAAVLGDGTPGGTGTTPVCFRKACPSGTRTFLIDDSLRRFHLLVDLESESLIAELRSPGRAKPLIVGSGDFGEGSLGQIDVLVGRLSQTAFTIDAARPSSGRGWTGKWSVTFIDPTGADPGAVVHSQIFLYGDLIPEFAGKPEFRMGTKSSIEVSVARRDGEPVEPEDFLQDVELYLSVTDPTSHKTERIPVEGSLRSRVFVGEYQPPDSTSSSLLNLTARLIATTSSGIALVPMTARVPVPVLPPAGFPRLVDSEIHPPVLVADSDEIESSSVEINVLGPAEGSGCIWFSGTSFDGELPPETAPPVASFRPDATGSASCLPLSAGERKSLRLTISEPVSGVHTSGTASGVLEMSLKSDATGEVVKRKVPVTMDILFKKSLPETVAMAIPIFLAGVGLPLFALWLLNAMTAKFQPPAHMRAAAIPVTVHDSGAITRHDGQSFSDGRSITHEEFQNVGGPTEPTREFTWRHFKFHTKTPLNPFGNPRGEVRGSYVAGSEGYRESEGASIGQVDLALTRTWAFALDAPGTQLAASEKKVRGELVMFISNTEPTVTQVLSMWPSVEDALPTRAVSLADLAAKDRDKLAPPPTEPPNGPPPDSGEPLPPSPDF